MYLFLLHLKGCKWIIIDPLLNVPNFVWFRHLFKAWTCCFIRSIFAYKKIFFFKNGPFPASFSLFSSFLYTDSGIGSDRSTNWATTTAQLQKDFTVSVNVNVAFLTSCKWAFGLDTFFHIICHHDLICHVRLFPKSPVRSTNTIVPWKICILAANIGF